MMTSTRSKHKDIRDEHKALGVNKVKSLHGGSVEDTHCTDRSPMGKPLANLGLGFLGQFCFVLLFPSR